MLSRQIIATTAELPPHARRILTGSTAEQLAKGTTSACAENTGRFQTPRLRTGNYLRMRGEYCTSMPKCLISAELPPHARRILINDQLRFIHIGTTSACAENTLIEAQAHITEGNYLRMRGEYVTWCVLPKGILELPPHARRIPILVHVDF